MACVSPTGEGYDPVFVVFEADNGELVVHRGCASFLNACLLLFLPADVGLVNFHNPGHQEGGVLFHGFPDAVTHKPGGCVSVTPRMFRGVGGLLMPFLPVWIKWAANSQVCTGRFVSAMTVLVRTEKYRLHDRQR